MLVALENVIVVEKDLHFAIVSQSSIFTHSHQRTPKPVEPPSQQHHQRPEIQIPSSGASYIAGPNLFVDQKNYTLTPAADHGSTTSAPAISDHGQCSLTPWSEWSPCAVTCGSMPGHQSRKRSRFGSKRCINSPEIEQRPCPKVIDLC